MNAQLLQPFFTKRPNRMVHDVPFEEYQRWPAINSSLLKEDTPYEAWCKLKAFLELPEDLRALLEMQGGDAATALKYLHDEKPRMVPRFFLRFLRMPEKADKASKPQVALVEQVRDAEGPVDAREFASKTVQICKDKGWVAMHMEEVEETGVTEEVKHGRIEALTEGTCIHEAILTPHLFDSGEWEKRWQLCPTKSLCSKKALEAQAEDPTRRLITPEIVDTARQARDAVWKHKEAARLLLEPGHSEVSMEVWDGDMQVMRKCRFDRLPDNRQAPVIDIKKTRKGLSVSELRSTIRQYGIHSQSAYYLDGLGFYGEPRTSYALIFVTDCDPFLARVVEINQHEDTASLVVDGRGIYTERLAAFCLGYHEGCKFSAYEDEGAYPLANGRNTPP